MMMSMERMPKHEKRANSRIALILFISNEPKPIVVVITAREVGNPNLLKHRRDASWGVVDFLMEEKYSGKIYMQ